MADLTEQQAAFAVNVVTNGGNVSKAAREAGYSAKTATQIGSHLMRKPHVIAAIQEEQRRTISGRLCSMAVAVLEQIMGDKDAPAGARLDAAKTVLDRGGIVAKQAPGAGAGGGLDKPLSEMTLEELDAFIAKGQTALRQVVAALPMAVDGTAERVG